ncbi:hypothetical protein [Accumulibacter sp.]|jgi:hypothetical protein|uniref:hypothetical protein n=1 Tax=Accumulibacter sp. TaxID=2053492 RepID=UPI001AC7A558|nr:hypothetical protein [Accumulibacter sp.]MBN8455562.1 hypothetical protein [Accumulibacter sp.]
MLDRATSGKQLQHPQGAVHGQESITRQPRSQETEAAAKTRCTGNAFRWHIVGIKLAGSRYPQEVIRYQPASRRPGTATGQVRREWNDRRGRGGQRCRRAFCTTA